MSSFRKKWVFKNRKKWREGEGSVSLKSKKTRNLANVEHKDAFLDFYGDYQLYCESKLVKQTLLCYQVSKLIRDRFSVLLK